MTPLPGIHKTIERFKGKSKALMRRVARYRPVKMTIHYPDFRNSVPNSTRFGRVAGGFRFTEGPVWLPESGLLLFTDIPANRIYCWNSRRVTVFREPSGKANGLALNQGRLLACEHQNRCVSSLDLKSGIRTVIADRFEGIRLNSPNDIVVTRDNTIFFTDPPYGIKAHEQELPWQGVYRIRPESGSLELVVSDCDRPNGLAFSPDERMLYISDSGRRHIRAYEVHAHGRLGEGRLFCNLNISSPGNPDGMVVDANGNLFCAGPGGVWVIDPDGIHLGTIGTPEISSNCTWGDIDLRTLYITARTSLYRLLFPRNGRG